MNYRQLTEMTGGWLVGDFEPSCLRTAACEVAYKHYEPGMAEAAHVHRIATEITLIASGRAMMNGRVLTTGDIVVLPPGEATDFQALEATLTVVVKVPSSPGDKYPIERPAESAVVTARVGAPPAVTDRNRP